MVGGELFSLKTQSLVVIVIVNNVSSYVVCSHFMILVDIYNICIHRKVRQLFIYIAADKDNYPAKYFSNFSTKTYIGSTHKKHFSKASIVIW